MVRYTEGNKIIYKIEPKKKKKSKKVNIPDDDWENHKNEKTQEVIENGFEK